MKKTCLTIFCLLLVSGLYAQAPIFTNINISQSVSYNYPIPCIPLNGKMVILADYGTTGYEYWITDGTTSGTHLIKDIFPGSTGSCFTFGGTVMNNKYFFTADDGIHGIELWATDGTTAGTTMIKDINPTASTSFDQPTIMTVFDGKIYFCADNDTNGYEPWVSDGTSTGTYMLQDIKPGHPGSYAHAFTVVNGKLLFVANNGTDGDQIWSCDGTASTLQMITNLYGSVNSGTKDFALFNNKLFFIAQTFSQGREIWSTDGTVSGTTMLLDLNPTGDGAIGLMVTMNNKLFFIGNDGITGDDLWTSDGTSTGTHLVKDINSTPISNLYASNNRLYFNIYNPSTGVEPWVSDGTSDGTFFLKDIFPGTMASNPYAFFSLKNRTYFGALTNFLDLRLWQTDGTTAKTKIVAPINATNISPILTNVHFVFNPADSSYYFNADFDSTGNKIWILKDTNDYSYINTATLNPTFSLYPNPNDGTFTVQLDNQNFEKGTVSVCDILGREVYSQTQIPNSKFSITLNQPKGIYLVKLQLDEAVLTKRVMVE